MPRKRVMERRRRGNSGAGLPTHTRTHCCHWNSRAVISLAAACAACSPNPHSATAAKVLGLLTELGYIVPRHSSNTLAEALCKPTQVQLLDLLEDEGTEGGILTGLTNNVINLQDVRAGEGPGDKRGGRESSAVTADSPVTAASPRVRSCKALRIADTRRTCVTVIPRRRGRRGRC